MASSHSSHSSWLGVEEEPPEEEEAEAATAPEPAAAEGVLVPVAVGVREGDAVAAAVGLPVPVVVGLAVAVELWQMRTVLPPAPCAETATQGAAAAGTIGATTTAPRLRADTCSEREGMRRRPLKPGRLIAARQPHTHLSGPATEQRPLHLGPCKGLRQEVRDGGVARSRVGGQQGARRPAQVGCDDNDAHRDWSSRGGQGPGSTPDGGPC